MEELAKLKKEPAVDRATKKNAFKTPPPKISAPSPKQKSKVSPESPPRPMSSRGPDATQWACNGSSSLGTSPPCLWNQTIRSLPCSQGRTWTMAERNQPREVSNGWWARGFRLGKGPVKYDQVLPCWLHFSCHSTYPIFSAKYPLLYHTISVDHGGKLQDMFVSRITKTLAKTNKLSRRKKRGWYTKEAMSKELGWSTSLVFK